MMRPKRIRRVVKHGTKYRSRPTDRDPVKIPPSPPISVPPAPTNADPNQELTMKLIEMVSEKKDPDKENTFTLIKFIITSVDPSSTFGKIFYLGLLVMGLIWLLYYVGILDKVI